MFVRGEECRAQFRVRVEKDLAQKTLVVQEKLGRQDALPIALLKQISGSLRDAPKGVFRMGLLPGLKLLVSFLGLQFIKKPEARVEFRHVQGRNRSLPGGSRCFANVNGPTHQYAAYDQVDQR